MLGDIAKRPHGDLTLDSKPDGRCLIIDTEGMYAANRPMQAPVRSTRNASRIMQEVFLNTPGSIQQGARVLAKTETLLLKHSTNSSDVKECQNTVPLVNRNEWLPRTADKPEQLLFQPHAVQHVTSPASASPTRNCIDKAIPGYQADKGEVRRSEVKVGNDRFS